MNQTEKFYKLLKEAPERQTRCSKAWLIGGNIIFVECKANVEIELEDAKEDMQLSEEMSTGITHFATIIDTANIKNISKEARDWYSQVQNDNPRNVSVALVVNSFYTRIIANFFLGFKNSRTEMKIFNEKDEAIKWLYEQL
mgnify:CR=1 FL=1|jgi:hypothetical protein